MACVQDECGLCQWASGNLAPGVQGTAERPRLGIKRLVCEPTLPPAHCVAWREPHPAHSWALSPLLFSMMRAQDEISGSQTGLQGPMGSTEKLCESLLKEGIESARRQAPACLPYVSQGSFYFYLLHVLNSK